LYQQVEDILDVLNYRVKYIQKLSFVKRLKGTKMKLKVGDKAPDFTLKSHLDQKVTLSELRGTTTVLVFFPLAWTPI
jgi:peroxiredoxin